MITIGTRLGPYEIVAPIGAGGMGEVYRARDTRLGREVAVKILPGEFGRDAQSKLRFEREAKIISRLSHPHICALYDVGDDYLVMELLDGETLAGRLARGPVPAAEAVQISIQIADALEQAHRAGIVHRDLKPGNVMLTSAGVKLLDFGLSKIGAQPPSAAEATEAKPLTEEGTIAGTLQYMAPEQLEGREADPRADIFALGATLYEMLCGRRAFDGPSRASVIAKILGSEPPSLPSLQRTTPAALDRIVRRCLAKQPALRWQCAGDIRRELELAGEPQVVERAPISRSRSLVVLALAFGLMAAALAAWLLLHRSPPSGADGAIRFIIEPPPDSLIKLSTDCGPPAVSPDGKTIVFIGSDALSGRRSLWNRELASVASKRVEGTDGAMFPFWSPDGTSIGFFASGKLKRVDLSGGAPQTLCAASFGRGGAWGADGQILFAPSPSEAIYRVSARGGAVERVTRLDTKAGEASHRWPSLLPDGRHLLVLVRRPGIAGAGQTGDAIYVADVRTGEKKLVTAASSNGMYVDPGRLLFVRDRTLFSQLFDLKALELGGEATPLLPNLQFHPAGFGMFSATSAVLCYQIGSLISELRVVDRRGVVTDTVGEPRGYTGPVLDAAHQQVVVSISDPGTGNQDVWQYELARKVERRITFHPADDFAPILSPDGKQVIFASNRSGFPQLYIKSIDGTEEERPLPSASQMARFPSSWSSDGRFVAFKEIAGSTQMDIDILDLKEMKERRLLASEFSESDAAFAPSGRWIAYTSDESGRSEVYVTTFPAASRRWKISSAGGSQPRWRGDENELYYVSADGSMMAVPIRTQPDFKAGTAQRLFSCELQVSRNAMGEYDVSPDGQRFLINTTAGHARSLPLTVAAGWQRKATAQ